MGAPQPPNTDGDAGIAYLSAIVAAAGGDVAMSDAAARALSAAADAASTPAPPAGLVALPCAKPSARWHLDALLATPARDAASLAKRLFHARLLGHLLAPEQPRFRPLVTILIPVYNRASLCAEAVESCLAQSWRPLEILVVDDGSTDDLASSLRPFGDAVRELRKPNGGVSSARNMGIAAARGDCIHFLDSDNLLHPDAVASKIEALAAIADAELCYSAVFTEPHGGKPSTLTHVPGGSERCPTRSLMAALGHRFPLFVSAVMMARWTVLAGAGFEEDLRSAEDVRYWMCLGLRGIKAIGLTAPLTVRRVQPDSLSNARNRPHEPRLIGYARNLRDVLVHREHWQHAGPFCSRFLGQHTAAAIATEPTLLLARVFDELRTVIGDLAGQPHGTGLTALPVLADLRGQFHAHRQRGKWSTRGDPCHRLVLGLERAIVDAITRAPGLTRLDVEFWLHESGAAPQSAIRRFLARLGPWNKSARHRCASATLLLRRLSRIPTPTETARYRMMRRWLGATAAGIVLQVLPASLPARRRGGASS